MFCRRNKDPVADAINANLQRGKQEKKSTIKILLLGAGETGKSTFFKQMRIIQGNGFPEEERIKMSMLVLSNILENTINLYEACKFFSEKRMNEKRGSIASDNNNTTSFEMSPETAEIGQKLTNLDAAAVEDWTTAIPLLEQAKKVWLDPAIQNTFGLSNQFQLFDSAKYFYDNIDRIAVPNYIPSVDDVLHIRVKTSGITDIEIPINDAIFKFVDVGGQRSERRKWIHCFDDVTVIIFFVSLSEYDQKLVEDNETNRLSESINLFKQLFTKDQKNPVSQMFANTPVILFLNKIDIFKEKLQKVPLSVLFKDYQGRNDPDEGADFIGKKFLESINYSSVGNKRQIYTFKTIATDTNNITVVFKVVKDIIIKENFAQLTRSSP